ncbi:MAG: VCBS repeat-containing protein, partial [Patescibacteria group bacterium]
MTTAGQGRVVALALRNNVEFLCVARHWCRLFVFLALLMSGMLWAGVAEAKHPRSVPLTVYSVDGEVKQTIALPLYNDTGGATVALGDTDGDGTAEVIVGNGYGNKPEVRILSQKGSETLRFLAFDSGATQGVNVAACDIDQDGRAEIVAALQAGGAPEVRVFRADGTPFTPHSFLAYNNDFKGGVSVARGAIDPDGVSEIVT